jgi:hypothetical protein
MNAKTGLMMLAIVGMSVVGMTLAAAGIKNTAPALVLVPSAVGVRTESTKAIIADTSTFKMRNEVLRFVIFDTLKITKTMKDTSLVVKIDTVKASSKPVPIK